MSSTAHSAFFVPHPALTVLQERIRAAQADGARLHISGSASKDFVGARALPEQRLDTRALAGILSYEPSELVVTAWAGTPLAELQALLAERGQCLPFEPPHFGPGATVGGMVAAGLSGPARASVGAVRDYVLGAQLLNGRAERLNFGGQVMKNVAGYDVSRLLAGSWGRLGVMAQLSLKVLAQAPAEATLRFALEQAQALAQLNAWGGQPLPLNASCWRQEDGQGQLYLRLRGARAAVQAACQRLGGERLGDAQSASDWADCAEQRLPWFTQRAPGHALWRLSVPDSAPPLTLPDGLGAPLIEWHGALRWLQAPPEAGAALQQAAAAVGGSAMLFRAAGACQTSATGDFDTPSGALGLIQARLRQAFDPAGIFA